ncbi:MAG TPA: BadF/BadG/BcrA/BcrD ATPase family protein [Streptosporangiaceae bacterium]|nr:BadF/BadG/BcrA/BcrD ATPase family protein [Streptosporangiaceae bacterium]
MTGHDEARLPAVIAVDGGNSKTDVALIGSDGSLLAGIRGPGMNPHSDGLAETVEVLGGLVHKAAAQAGGCLSGLGPSAGPDGGLNGVGGLVARHMSACVANADLPEEEERVRAAFQEQGWTQTTSVVNDTFAVLRAGLTGGEAGGHWGVAVTCGAGINCVGVAPDGRTSRFLALGSMSGDWGGGYGLGRAVIWYAIRAEDGRGEQTVLRETVPSHFGVKTMHDVAVGIHKGTITGEDQVALSPVLFAAAAAGDKVAVSLVGRQAEEIFLMAFSAMRRLDLLGLPTPVVLGGGVVTARDPLLTAGITSRLAAQAPHAAIRMIDVPPIAGAALLGLDRVNAGPDAQAKLCAAYTPAQPARPGTGPGLA